MTHRSARDRTPRLTGAISPLRERCRARSAALSAPASTAAHGRRLSLPKSISSRSAKRHRKLISLLRVRVSAREARPRRLPDCEQGRAGCPGSGRGARGAPEEDEAGAERGEKLRLPAD
jgi:hypothetical protein